MKIEISFDYREQEVIRTVLKAGIEADGHFKSKVGGYDALVRFPIGEKRDSIEVTFYKGEETMVFVGTVKEFGIDMNPPQPG